MELILGAFDFDYTIIKENSDFVVRDLLPSDVIKQRLETFYNAQGWTAYMAETFQILFEEGFNEEKIKETITSISAVPDFVSLFRRLREINCEIVIISDSNTYFIDEWLKSHKIRDTVHTIYSNPAHFSEGKLIIEKYHEQDWCNLSTRNLCKGYILQSHIDKRRGEGAKFNRIFYVGDGHNDLCPSLKLQTGDLVFPRIGFPLLEQLQLFAYKVKAQVIPWENTSQIFDALNKN